MIGQRAVVSILTLQYTQVLPRVSGVLPDLSRTLPVSRDLSRFSPRFDSIFSGKYSIQFLADKMQDFWNFVLHNCIVDLTLSLKNPQP